MALTVTCKAASLQNCL